MLWIWLVLLYGVLKGCREICKKKALLTCTPLEVLLVYSFVGFLLVCPDAPHAMGLAPKFYLYIALKSFVIFVAWICGFHALKQLPISFYGVLDLSRVLFSTLLGIIVLREVMSPFTTIGLVLVSVGLLMLRWQPAHNTVSTQNSNTAPLSDPKKTNLSRKFILLALASALLNAVSGLMDKILMLRMNSSQMQFWYMLFLCLFYLLYAIFSRTKINLKKAVTNKWIWLLSIMFIIADRALFVANGMDTSRVTVMTLLKQSGCIVTILAGRFLFKEENTGHKFLCAAIIIAGIVLSVM